MSKAREFWITLHHNEYDVLMPLHAFFSREKAYDERAKLTVHVIEYSAYLAEKERGDKAHHEWKRWNDEYLKLLADSEKLRAALKKISRCKYDDVGPWLSTIAKEALSEWDKKRGAE